MKTIKIENKLTLIILNHALFLLYFKYQSILGLIIGTIISIPIILFINKKNIYKHKITKYIILILSIFSLCFYLNKTTYFISDNILKEYSLIPISFLLITTIYYLGNKGYHTIIKVIIISSYFIIFKYIVGILLLTQNININNIIILNNNLLLNIFITIFINIYSYFLIIPITNTKINMKDLLIPNIFNELYYLIIISSLKITNIFKYPYVIIFKKINLLNFIERIEIIFSLNYLYIFFFLLLLIFYQIKYILNIKSKKKQLILLIISLFIYLFSFII